MMSYSQNIKNIRNDESSSRYLQNTGYFGSGMAKHDLKTNMDGCEKDHMTSSL